MAALVLLLAPASPVAATEEVQSTHDCQKIFSEWPSMAAAADGGFSDNISVECGTMDHEYWGPNGGGEICVNIKVSNTGDCDVIITYPGGGFEITPGRSRGRQTQLHSGQFVGYQCAVGSGTCRFTITISSCVGVATAELAGEPGT